MPRYENCTLSIDDTEIATGVTVDYVGPARSINKTNNFEQEWGGTILNAPDKIEGNTKYQLQIEDFPLCTIQTKTRMDNDTSIHFRGVGLSPDSQLQKSSDAE